MVSFEIVAQVGEMEFFHLLVSFETMSYMFPPNTILGTMKGRRNQWPSVMICLLRKVIIYTNTGRSNVIIWMFPKIGVPQNGLFIMENPIKMDDLGVALFLETPIY